MNVVKTFKSSEYVLDFQNYSSDDIITLKRKSTKVISLKGFSQNRVRIEKNPYSVEINIIRNNEPRWPVNWQFSQSFLIESELNIDNSSINYKKGDLILEIPPEHNQSQGLSVPIKTQLSVFERIKFLFTKILNFFRDGNYWKKSKSAF